MANKPLQVCANANCNGGVDGQTKKNNSWAAKRTCQKKISRPPTGKEGETPETPETRGT